MATRQTIGIGYAATIPGTSPPMRVNFGLLRSRGFRR